MSDAVCSYYVDPVSTINKGLKQYNAVADAEMRRTKYNSKLPGVPYGAPTIQQLQGAQELGPDVFRQLPERQRGECTRPQLDVMPDLIGSSWYPVPATVETAIEPFSRQGADTRWQAKQAACTDYKTRY